MDFYPFGFTVIFHEEYDSETHISTYRRESGMGLAQSYANAMEQIEHHYGDDLIAVKHLELFAENTLISLPENIIHGYSKTEFGYEGELCDIDGNPIESLNKEVI